MLDQLRMNWYISKVDVEAAKYEPYRKLFGRKPLTVAFAGTDQFDEFTAASFAAWRAGIPAPAWAILCACALLDGASIGETVDFTKELYPHVPYWNRYSAVLNQLTREMAAVGMKQNLARAQTHDVK